MTALPAYPIDQILTGKDGHAPALQLRDRVYSYEELNSYVGRLSHFLGEQGFAAGARVACWTGKGLIACIVPLAAARAGMVYVPINPQLKAAQVAYILSDCGAELCVANTARAAALAAAGVDCRTIDDIELAKIAEADGSQVNAPHTSDCDALAALLYTSGSTGRPKGVMLSHANLSLGAVSVAQYLTLAPDDRTLAVLPLSFDYGQNQLYSTWHAGGCVVPLDYLTPRDLIKACSREKITTLAAVPPLWVQLAELDWPTEASAPLRRLTNSGGALTEPLVRRLRALFPNADLYPMYGLTEAFRSTYLSPELVDSHPTSMGRAIPFAEILVVDANGQECTPGEPGELVHCGPLVAKGYWQDLKRTAERFRPAPEHSEMGGIAVWSGDSVRRDHDGLLYFQGREDAMIKVSGNRISPTEIEEIAMASGKVTEALAIGRTNDRTGAEIWLFVRGEGSDAPLSAHFKKDAPSFMHPSRILWLDSFPKNPNGKIDRHAIVQAIEAGEFAA